MIGINQETFDIVWNGLKAQNWQQATRLRENSDYLRCGYRGTVTPGKCAIGHLIPDEKYDESCESCGARAALLRCGVEFKNDDKTEMFLTDLQAAHDQGFPMEARLRKVAARYGLKVPK